jgi:hypothetical protein
MEDEAAGIDGFYPGHCKLRRRTDGGCCGELQT